MRGEADAHALEDAHAATLERYRESFGEPPEDTWLPTEASKCGRTNCKVQKCK